MARLEWDKTGERLYETGVSHGVLYVMNGSAYEEGVAWNGLTAVTESPEGAEATDLWADDDKYLSMRSKEKFNATIEAYTYPEEFEACDGTASLGAGVTIGQQTRKPFALCYRTVLGNDTESNDHGYKIHIIYGATCSPSEKAYSTINDSPEAITFSWSVETTPVAVAGFKPTATVVIDSTKFAGDLAAKLTAIEDSLYGTSSKEPTLLMPDEIKALLS